MLNVLKMDFYRLFKTKSLYVIWGIMMLVILLTTYISKEELDIATERTEVSQELQELPEEVQPENMNLGIIVTLPTEGTEKVTLYDILFGNSQGKVIALFIVIFTVIFSMADMNSGYIKNIGGQVENRRKLIISKAITLFIFTILTMLLFAVVQAIANGIFFGYMKFGNVSMLCKYYGIEVILHFALALICMTLAMIIRNNVVSMILAICLCMNVLTVFYGVVDNILKKFSLEDFHILNYTITGKITLLPMELTGRDGISALLVAVVFIIVMVVISSVVFEKRDIV